MVKRMEGADGGDDLPEALALAVSGGSSSAEPKRKGGSISKTKDGGEKERNGGHTLVLTHRHVPIASTLPSFDLRTAVVALAIFLSTER
jgi:hypothetical protein